MSAQIIQTGIGLDQHTLARCDRLRACYGRSRSWVIEQALRGAGLDGLEADKTSDIATFDGLASLAGITWQDYARAYVDAFGAKTYPPTVAQLAEIGFTGTESDRALARKVTQLESQRARRDRAAAKERQEQRIESDVQQLLAPVRSLRDLR